MNERQIFTVIFGKENASDEELWNAGFGRCERKIEVESENIINYSRYKQDFLWKNILHKFGKSVKTDWVKLPKKQKEQVDMVMKLIAYSVFSAEDGLTVENISSSTINFLNRLGYKAWSSGDKGWIYLDDAKKSLIESGEYLTAETAETLSNLINSMVLYNFLQEKKEAGLQFVIIPTANIPRGITMDKKLINDLSGEVLQKLGVEFDLYTFIEFHTHQQLTFIDLTNFDFNKEVQTKELESLKRYLPGTF